jgi:hypothetical protein
MQLAITTVSYEGYANEAWNDKRLRVAERALIKACELGAHVLVLPGGFFTTRTDKARNSIATHLINIAKRQNVAAIFGVDQHVKNLSADYGPEIKRGALPFYAYVWSPIDEGPPLPWNQRSTNSQNQVEAPEALCREVRLIKITDDETVAILICGEIFNQRIRYALAEYRPRPKLVVDIAHTGHRFRVEQGMKKLAEQGFSSVCSVHVQCEFAMKRCYIAGKGLASTRTCDASLFGLPSIELKLCTF